MIKQREYAGLMPNYQQLGAQQGQIWGGATQELFKALSQMLAQREADTFAKNNPLFDESITKGSMAGVPQPTVAEYTPRTENILAGFMSNNPLVQQRTQRAVQGIQLTQPKFEAFDTARDLAQTNALAGRTGIVQRGVPKPVADKRIGQGTVGGRMVATMQKADGTTYTIDLGESFDGERLKNAKASIDIARKRLDAMQDKDAKAEGKYLIRQYDNAENQYNKNMMYLSDPNISDDTRRVLQEQQVSLVNEMDAYARDINALGGTATQVITQPTTPTPVKTQTGAPPKTNKPKLF